MAQAQNRPIQKLIFYVEYHFPISREILETNSDKSDRNYANYLHVLYAELNVQSKTKLYMPILYSVNLLSCYQVMYKYE